MSDHATKSSLYVRQGCPFCLKLRIFLLEADLLAGVEMREFAEGAPEEAAIRAELAPHFEKVTFPTIRLSDGEYLADSDAIIARIASASGVETTGLPTFRAYADGFMPRVTALFRENSELRKRLG